MPFVVAERGRSSTGLPRRCVTCLGTDTGGATVWKSTNTTRNRSNGGAQPCVGGIHEFSGSW